MAQDFGLFKHLFVLQNAQHTHGLGVFFSQALPSSVGGDAYKIFQIKTLRDFYKGAFCSVVSDRLFGLIGVIMLILMFPFAALAIGHQKILGFDIKFLMYTALTCMILYFFFS